MDATTDLLPDTRPWPPAPGAGAVAATLTLVALSASLAKLATDFLPVFAPDLLPLVFLVAVLVAAVAFGFWSGLLAACTSFAALNFLFTPPLYTFNVTRVSDLVALVEFLLVAGLAGWLTGRLHERAEAARVRAEALAVLGDLSMSLAGAETEKAALQATLAPLARLCQGEAVVMTPEGLLPDGAGLDPVTQAACDRALRSQQPQAAAAPGWEGSRLTFVPLAEGLVLGHTPPPGREGHLREIAIVQAVRLTQLALQRLAFAAHARAERQRAEAEATRAAVLASFGHDLRTPLATILGAASALKDLELAPPARTDLLTAIEEEALRLNAHVGNLMQLSRLEAQAPMRCDWVDIGDLATAAAARLRRARRGEIRLDLGDLPMLRSEGGLIEQALFNLMDNAFAHGCPPVTVTAMATNESLCVAVSDAGHGLPAALAAWLSGPDLRPALGQGGLGLAVAKGIARHLGGQLTSEGATFTFRLPT